MRFASLPDVYRYMRYACTVWVNHLSIYVTYMTKPTTRTTCNI